VKVRTSDASASALLLHTVCAIARPTLLAPQCHLRCPAAVGGTLHNTFAIMSETPERSIV